MTEAQLNKLQDICAQLSEHFPNWLLTVGPGDKSLITDFSDFTWARGAAMRVLTKCDTFDRINETRLLQEEDRE